MKDLFNWFWGILYIAMLRILAVLVLFRGYEVYNKNNHDFIILIYFGIATFCVFFAECLSIYSSRQGIK